MLMAPPPAARCCLPPLRCTLPPPPPPPPAPQSAATASPGPSPNASSKISMDTPTQLKLFCAARGSTWTVTSTGESRVADQGWGARLCGPVAGLVGTASGPVAVRLPASLAPHPPFPLPAQRAPAAPGSLQHCGHGHGGLRRQLPLLDRRRFLDTGAGGWVEASQEMDSHAARLQHRRSPPPARACDPATATAFLPLPCKYPPPPSHPALESITRVCSPTRWCMSWATTCFWGMPEDTTRGALTTSIRMTVA